MKWSLRIFAAMIAAVAIFAQSSPSKQEFEVASIKPSPPGNPQQVNIGVHIDGAQVRCTYLSLKDYIQMAYQLKHYQVIGPDWIASERFDIAAKLPAGAASDQVREMLKMLLTERFQMKMHHDTKEFPVYGLVAAKGGLKMKETPPDPDKGSGDPDSAAPQKGAVNVAVSGGRGGTSVNVGNGSYFTFADNKFVGKKLPMTALADTLSRFVDRPVVDMTELKGNYDFTLEFTPEDFRAMQIRGALAAGVSLPPEALRALDMSSGDSIFTAMQQLGLKLETRKAPLEVLVIDQLLKAPTEN